MYLDTVAAARLLSTTPEALLARCRRGMRREKGWLVAKLVPGVEAVKMGRSWRFRVDPGMVPGALGGRGEENSHDSP